MIGPHLKIDCPSPVGHQARIELNGMDISSCCTGVELFLSVGEVNQAVLKLHVGKLEVTEETLVMLQAHLHQQEPS